MAHQSPREDLPEEAASLLFEWERLQHCCEEQRKEIKSLRDQNQYAEMEKELLQNLVLECEQKLEHKLEHKDSEILGLHVLIDTWKADCNLYRESLVKAKQDADALHKENQLLGAEVERRKGQLHKIIPILQDKVRMGRVCRTALLAIAGLVRTVKEKNKIKSLYDRSDRAIHPKFIENETRGLLKEAGIELPNDASGAPAQTPNKDDDQDEQAPGAKRKRLE
ncbi:hypothetical protein ACJ41O_009455 [Fusarium nematophilum]